MLERVVLFPMQSLKGQKNDFGDCDHSLSFELRTRMHLEESGGKEVCLFFSAAGPGHASSLHFFSSSFHESIPLSLSFKSRKANQG